MKQKPITRKEALAKGYKFYYTGKKCKNGHNDLRYVSTYVCLECHREHRKTEAGKKANYRAARKYYLKNKDKVHEYNRKYYKKYYQENKDKFYGYMKKWRGKNKEYLKAQRSVNRKELLEQRREWVKNNPEKMEQYNAKKRAQYAAARGGKVRKYERG